MLFIKYDDMLTMSSEPSPTLIIIKYDQCWGVKEYMYRRYVFRIQIIANCIPLQLVGI